MARPRWDNDRTRRGQSGVCFEPAMTLLRRIGWVAHVYASLPTGVEKSTAFLAPTHVRAPPKHRTTAPDSKHNAALQETSLAVAPVTGWRTTRYVGRRFLTQRDTRGENALSPYGVEGNVLSIEKGGENVEKISETAAASVVRAPISRPSGSKPW